MTRDVSNELRRLAESLLALSERLPVGQADTSPFQFSGTDEEPDVQLVAVARKTLASRMVRKKHLPHDMFGEGGWNILLDLFISEAKGIRVSITDACVASDLPSTTALRHIGLLIERGLLWRVQDPRDSRRVDLGLTPAGRKTIRAVLCEIANIDEMYRAERVD